MRRKGYMKTALFLAGWILFSDMAGTISIAGTVSAGATQISESLLSGSTVGAIIQFEKTYEEKLKEAEDRKKALEEKKAETEQRIKDNELIKENILIYIEELDTQIFEVEEEIERLNGEIATAEESLEETKIKLAEAENQEKAQYEAMKRRIQYMYENGETSVLDLLIGAGNLSDLLNRVEYQKEITEYDNQLLADYTAAKLEVSQQKQMLEVKLDELAVMKETAEFNQETLEALSADKLEELQTYLAAIEMDEDLFSDYAEEIVAAEMDIDEIVEEERKRIEEEERRRKEEEARRAAEEAERKRKAEEARKAAEEAAAKAEAESDAKRLEAINGVTVRDVSNPDDMIWPLPGDGRIYSYFGPRKAPTKGASTYHRGLDIGGVTGASIVSVLSGTVTEAAYNASRGRYVKVDHGNGYCTFYMHCSKLLVSVGDKVRQGDVLGLVGSTGISTGPHLHFSLTINGTYVDPLKYVQYSK